MAAVRTGLELVHMRYVLGDTAGLPPDVNGDDYPDHLGDVAPGEPTLFDAILDPPIPHNDNGWKQDDLVPFGGPLYVWVYDLSGSMGMSSPGEGTIVYDSPTGNLYTFRID